MSRMKWTGGGSASRPAAAGPPVRRAVALPSVEEDPLQALKPAARRSAAGEETRPETASGTTAEASADTAEAAPQAPQAPQAQEEPSAGAQEGAREGAQEGAQESARPRAAAASRSADATAGLAAAGTAARGGSGAANGAGDGSPGRPKKPMLAAAAIAGAVLISVPLLVMVGDDSENRTERDQVTALAVGSEASEGEGNNDTETLYDKRVAQPPKTYAPAAPDSDASGTEGSGASGSPGTGETGTGDVGTGESAAPTTIVTPGTADLGAQNAQNAQKQEPEPSSAPSTEVQAQQQAPLVRVVTVAPTAKAEKKHVKSSGAADGAETVAAARVPTEMEVKALHDGREVPSDVTGSTEEQKQTDEQEQEQKQEEQQEQTEPQSQAESAKPSTSTAKPENEVKRKTEKTTSVEVITVYASRLVSADSGKCLVTTARAVGGELAIMPCGSGEEQYWVVHPDDTIRNGDLCITLADGATSDNTALRLENCNGSDAQKFRLNENDDLVPLKAQNMCADVLWQDDFDGTPVRLWPCTGLANQTWTRA